MSYKKRDMDNNINYTELARCIVAEMKANNMAIAVNEDRVLITGKEVADMLGVSQATVSMMRKARKIRAVFPNKVARYYKDEIIRYMNKRNV